MNLVIGLLLAALTTTTTPAGGDKPNASPAPERTPIFLQTDAQDAVGAAYVAKLRDAIDASAAYRPVINPSGARFVVGIVTMDPNESDPASGIGRSTVAAVTLQRGNGDGLNEFVYSWVLVAKRDRVDSLVAELLAAIDSEIQGLERPVIQITAVP